MLKFLTEDTGREIRLQELFVTFKNRELGFGFLVASALSWFSWTLVEALLPIGPV